MRYKIARPPKLCALHVYVRLVRDGVAFRLDGVHLYSDASCVSVSVSVSVVVRNLGK